MEVTLKNGLDFNHHVWQMLRNVISSCLIKQSITTAGRPILSRNYALSRFPLGRRKAVGSGRVRDRPSPASSSQRTEQSTSSEDQSSKNESESPLWNASATASASTDSDPALGLERLLMDNQALFIERQIEMMNIFLGFEQCNRYTITNESGNTVGHIVEEDSGLFSMMRRQAFATHRPFRAMVMDPAGSPLLWLRRPFAWINSRMYVQRLKDLKEHTEDGQPILETFAEVQQVWHLLRRKYELYIRDPASSKRILSLATDSEQPTPEPVQDESEKTRFLQLAYVDEPFLSWNFHLRDETTNDFAFISRGFRGFARELFTDTGKYTVVFQPSNNLPTISVGENLEWQSKSVVPKRHLSLDERALILALSINIDFDYFSRHSHAGPGGGMFMFGNYE